LTLRRNTLPESKKRQYESRKQIGFRRQIVGRQTGLLSVHLAEIDSYCDAPRAKFRGAKIVAMPWRRPRSPCARSMIQTRRAALAQSVKTVFPRDKRCAFARRSCSNNELKRDDD